MEFVKVQNILQWRAQIPKLNAVVCYTTLIDYHYSRCCSQNAYFFHIARLCVRVDRNNTLVVTWDEWREFLLLHPSSNIHDIFIYWRHATVAFLAQTFLVSTFIRFEPLRQLATIKANFKIGMIFLKRLQQIEILYCFSPALFNRNVHASVFSGLSLKLSQFANVLSEYLLLCSVIVFFFMCSKVLKLSYKSVFISSFHGLLLIIGWSRYDIKKFLICSMLLK